MTPEAGFLLLAVLLVALCTPLLIATALIEGTDHRLRTGAWRCPPDCGCRGRG